MTSLLPSLGIIGGILLLGGLLALGWRWRLRRRRTLSENALKQIYTAQLEGRASTASEIAGRLGLSPGKMLRLAQTLESAGLVRSRAGVMDLTQAGLQRGMEILRGHRLWEHYLSGDAQVPLERLHDAAERAEHRLSTDDIGALADHLGHPRTDPHGDVIPTARGEIQAQRRTPLSDWPLNRFAVVVHVEDEPRQSLREAVASGLQPGTALRVMARDANSVTCETSTGRCIVSPAVAANVDVRAALAGEDLGTPSATLAALPLGGRAEVVAISDRCMGLGRRRLLDLGFTAGAPVKAVLKSMHGETHAYEIRGSIIALRKEQAEQVLVRPVGVRAGAQAGAQAGANTMTNHG